MTRKTTQRKPSKRKQPVISRKEPPTLSMGKGKNSALDKSVRTSRAEAISRQIRRLKLSQVQRLTPGLMLSSGKQDVADNDSSQVARTHRQRRNPRHQQHSEEMLDNYLTATSELQLRQLALEEKQFEADVKLKGARLELEYEDIKLSREQRSDTIEVEMEKMTTQQQKFAPRKPTNSDVKKLKRATH
ncbi:hypothetical protein GN244_ATG16326 [Phytophthora infestans]|uniref:Uncharacterized protein n=1 Tax=Phytophthora infestans TaxID=4787 RepID=A0A833RS14_PHYIN|nr:hypothetical protein GN244_ATG16326 [Phytophthora infestans]KAF4135972.1 hypothetical protein GN958_ATG14837 [Phytophthora infestans]